MDACGWLTLTKLVACKGDLVQTGTFWQLRFWVQAQAGNRAGKTKRQLQWWENSVEWACSDRCCGNKYNKILSTQ